MELQEKSFNANDTLLVSYLPKLLRQCPQVVTKRRESSSNSLQPLSPFCVTDQPCENIKGPCALHFITWYNISVQKLQTATSHHHLDLTDVTVLVTSLLCFCVAFVFLHCTFQGLHVNQTLWDGWVSSNSPSSGSPAQGWKPLLYTTKSTMST